MNSYAHLQSVRYQTLEQATSLPKCNSYLAKVDLKAAYLTVPIHPSDYVLTGLHWKFGAFDEDVYLFDT